jgi:hemolysin-activating ACP:hemolysin acyltransferase
VPSLFPRKTIAWEVVEDPTAIRRLTLSLPEMALVTGILLRLYRAYVLSHGSGESWIWVGSTMAIGAVVLLVMLTVHLSHYPVRHWWWRAPMFAALEAGTEILMSFTLTAVGLEKVGSGVAALSDWLPGAERILLIRVLVIVPFTALLAVVVTLVRKVLLAREHRTSTAQRVSEAHRVVEEPPSPPAA